MIFKLFSVHDRASETFNRPMFLAAKGVAIRHFQDEANNTESPICQHPEDYELFYIGDFNDETAQLTSCRPESCGKATDYKEEK
jgi:hypothetical protein